MRTVLVTGGANGLGAAFVKAYSEQDNTTVLSLDLVQSSQQKINVREFVTDISSEDSVKQCADSLRGTKIDLLIHSAGIRGLVPQVEADHPEDVAACETMDVMDVSTLERTFRINAIGTFILLRAFLPSLRLASCAKVVIMSSRMGSIGINEKPNKDAGSAYAYRASKAALNTIVRSFAVDLPAVTFILCHPGRVETKLVLCQEEGAITVEESLASIMPLIDTWNVKDSGKFFDRFGSAIEW